ncbi:hypothetical protein ABT282_07230 [Streptomyces sp. NPDC000927]|uniref:hypothetical protein n=1 Tax=Streptomyces sp. NPDC000927 TaxID=3154371 RepID=UPI003327117F
MANARNTGRVHYIVDPRDEEDFGVIRINQIGMGWAVNSYKTQEAADRVADFLSEMVDEEQWAELSSDLRG